MNQFHIAELRCCVILPSREGYGIWPSAHERIFAGSRESAHPDYDDFRRKGNSSPVKDYETGIHGSKHGKHRRAPKRLVRRV